MGRLAAKVESGSADQVIDAVEAGNVRHGRKRADGEDKAPGADGDVAGLDGVARR